MNSAILNNIGILFVKIWVKECVLDIQKYWYSNWDFLYINDSKQDNVNHCYLFDINLSRRLHSRYTKIISLC